MTLFSGIKKLVAGLSTLLCPWAGGERAVLDAQDTGCGHHPGCPPPAFISRVVAASALAELIPEKSVICP
jgi:hypothetical protein